jgi:hypothetical protein
MKTTREYDVFVPLHYNDGTPVEPEKLDRLRRRLSDYFGGLTDTRTRNAGEWKAGGVTFHDEVVIYRVYGDVRRSQRFIRELKEDMKREFRQQDVLVVARKVHVV